MFDSKIIVHAPENYNLRINYVKILKLAPQSTKI